MFVTEFNARWNIGSPNFRLSLRLCIVLAPFQRKVSQNVCQKNQTEEFTDSLVLPRIFDK